MADDDRKIDFLGMLTQPRKPASQSKGRAREAAPPAQKSAEAEPPPAKRASQGAGAKGEARSKGSASKAAKKSPNRGNYLGGGLYLHKGGEKRKMTSYIDPAIHKEVKVAGAGGDDPRGSDMSEIVENALRAFGFGGAEQA